MHPNTVRWILLAIAVVCLALYVVANRRRLARLEAELIELHKAEAIVARAQSPRRRHLRVVSTAAPPFSAQLAEMLDERPPLDLGDRRKRP